MAAPESEIKRDNFTLTVTGLFIRDDEREAWERDVAAMNRTAEQLRGLDPEGVQPALVFDPRK